MLNYNTVRNIRKVQFVMFLNKKTTVNHQFKKNPGKHPGLNYTQIPNIYLIIPCIFS